MRFETLSCDSDRTIEPVVGGWTIVALISREGYPMEATTFRNGGAESLRLIYQTGFILTYDTRPVQRSVYLMNPGDF